MRVSILDLFPRFYDVRQTVSAAVYVGHMEMTLIEDRTDSCMRSAARCRVRWRSRRDKLDSGSGEGEGDGRLLDPRAHAGDDAGWGRHRVARHGTPRRPAAGAQPR